LHHESKLQFVLVLRFISPEKASESLFAINVVPRQSGVNSEKVAFKDADILNDVIIFSLLVWKWQRSRQKGIADLKKKK